VVDYLIISRLTRHSRESGNPSLSFKLNFLKTYMPRIWTQRTIKMEVAA
jgi:hypothetical protein